MNTVAKPNNDAVVHQILETHFAATQLQITRLEEVILASHAQVSVVQGSKINF